LRLPDDEGHHLARVLRAREGDVVHVFDGAGRERAATVAAVGKGGVLVDLGPEIPAPRPAREVVLCTAIPRGERMEWLVEKAVEAGVARIYPIAADRSVRKETGENSLRRWRRAAIEAAKQCGRADVPEVTEPMALRDAALRSGDGVRLVATPGAAAKIPDLASGASRVILFVGPEGGFAPGEQDEIERLGARRCDLGPLVLRIETAAVVAVHLAAN
jgi:16S rRNA (uracil1498-N3)-methyltransferase